MSETNRFYLLNCLRRTWIPVLNRCGPVKNVLLSEDQVNALVESGATLVSADLSTILGGGPYNPPSTLPGPSTGPGGSLTYEQLVALLEKKQDLLLGREGQFVGFDAEGKPVAVDAPSAGETYEFGHGIAKDGNKISVKMASDADPDKTLPISAADVKSAIGEVEVVLVTI